MASQALDDVVKELGYEYTEDYLYHLENSPEVVEQKLVSLGDEEASQ